MFAEILLLVNYIVLSGVVLKNQKDHAKLIDGLLNKLKESTNNEIALRTEKIKLMSIIVEGKKNKEISYQTLDKIEKELLGNNSQ